ncbi:MAG: diacylglycerol kinase [Pseudomonadota bacterium]
MKPNNPGLTHVVAAFGYSMKGIRAAFIHERAFRLELVAGLILFPLALWLGRSGVEFAILLGSLFLVLAFEMVNSSIEAVVDRVGTDFHELSGRAKDLGSASVFFAQMNAVVVWACILYDRFI